MTNRRFKLFNRKSLLILFFLILCFFGFHRGGRFYGNAVRWPSEQGGLSFSPNSMIFGKNLFSDGKEENGPMSLNMEIRPRSESHHRFGIILQIFNSDTKEELTIGQWGSSLMVLNTNDYSNRKRMPKIYAAMDSDKREKSIDIQSDSTGTTLKIGGDLKGKNKELKLDLPRPFEKNILVLGNGISGRTPWRGEILSVSLGSTLNFDFTQKSPNSYPGLIIPERVTNLNPAILRRPSLRSLESGTMFTDIFLNFTGFIPFGYLLFLNLKRKERHSIAPVLLASGIAFFFSLSIEITQIWIPGRDSSMLDLILNTAGGSCGALAAWIRKTRKSV